MKPSTLLVAHGDPVVLRTLERVFEAEGYRVLATPDPSEAIELFVRERPDLVVLDADLPRLGGAVALEDLRNLDPDVLAVGTSSRGDAAALERLLEAGARDVLPLDVEALKSSVSTLLLTRGVEAAPEVSRPLLPEIALRLLRR